MARRILSFIEDIVLRRRTYEKGQETIAGLISAEKPARRTIACRIILQYIPNYSTIAGKLLLQDSLIRTIAGTVNCIARKRATIAGTVKTYVVATIAGTFGLQYSNRETIASRVRATANRISPISCLITLCKRETIAGFLICSRTKAATVSGRLKNQKVMKSTMAGVLKLQSPSWEQSMSGA